MHECAVLLKEVRSYGRIREIFCLCDFNLFSLWSQGEYLDWEDCDGEINIRLITKVWLVCEFYIVSLTFRKTADCCQYLLSNYQYMIVYNHVQNLSWFVLWKLNLNIFCYWILDWGQIKNWGQIKVWWIHWYVWMCFLAYIVIKINSNQCLLPFKPEVNVEKELNSHSFYARHNFSHSLKLISIDLY